MTAVCTRCVQSSRDGAVVMRGDERKGREAERGLKQQARVMRTEGAPRVYIIIINYGRGETSPPYHAFGLQHMHPLPKSYTSS